MQQNHTLGFTAASVCHPSSVPSTVCSVDVSFTRSRSSWFTTRGCVAGKVARHSGHSGLARCTCAMHCRQPLCPARAGARSALAARCIRGARCPQQWRGFPGAGSSNTAANAKQGGVGGREHCDRAPHGSVTGPPNLPARQKSRQHLTGQKGCSKSAVHDRLSARERLRFSHRAPRSRPRRPESRPPCRASAAAPLTRRLAAPLLSRRFQGGETCPGPPRPPQLLAFHQPEAAWDAGWVCPGSIRLTQLRCRPGQARCMSS